MKIKTKLLGGAGTRCGGGGGTISPTPGSI